MMLTCTEVANESELSSFNESVLPAWHFQNILGSGKDAMQAFHKKKKIKKKVLKLLIIHKTE